MDLQEWLNSEETIRKSKKSYAHFDIRTDIKRQKGYISDPETVSRHGFYPFIHYELTMNKFSSAKGCYQKSRDICYAAHIDRCIYQLYSFILNQLYNNRVKHDGISDVAVAYRTDLHGSNITFSKRVFDFIKQLGKCYVMVGDFTNFFDNLDHQYLKQQWCSLLNCGQLPKDHYNVFKNVTSYSKWELTDLLDLNGLKDNPAGKMCLNKQIRAITPEQFKANRKHIIKNPNHYGIPQGSPISAVLANVYMLDVDKQINDMITSIGGMYMRYSDDFMIIIPDAEEIRATDIFSKVHISLKAAPRLSLEPRKTQYFYYCNGHLENCGKLFHKDSADKKQILNFLGFTFDGQRVSIRSKTVIKYYYRMYSKAKTITKHGGYTPEGKHISCVNLYRRYSERGSTGKSGNFLSYVNRAAELYGADEYIRRDTKRHMQKIRKALKKSPQANRHRRYSPKPNSVSDQ